MFKNAFVFSSQLTFILYASLLLCLHQAKLAELQDLVMRLVAERNEWYSRYTGAVAGTGQVNPDLLPVGEDHAHPVHQAHAHTELNAASGAGRHSQ